MGLILPRNPLAYPGGQPSFGFDPNHIANVVPNQSFSAVALPGSAAMRGIFGGVATPTVGGSAASIMDGAIGASVKFGNTAGDNNLFGSLNFVVSTTAATYAAILRLNTIAGGRFVMSGTGFDGISSNNSGLFQIFLGNAAKSSSVTLVAGHVYFIAASIKSASTCYYIVVDLTTGAIKPGSVSAGVSNLGGGNTTYIGNSSAGTASTPSSIACAMRSNSFLGPAQLAAWAQAPWDYWYPPRLGGILFDALGGVLHVITTAVGEADGAATVSGVGAAISKAAGEADGVASVSGVSATAAASAGEADGYADVSGVSASASAATGEADGYADVSGVAGLVIGARGEADGYADVSGVGAYFIAPLALPTLPGIGFPVHRRPTFRTVVSKHPSGGDVRTALWRYPLWEFELAFDGLSASASDFHNLRAKSFQEILGFYLTTAGASETFFWIDPDFNTALDQPAGTGDGATTSFFFMRSVGISTEPASWVTGAPTVYDNGTPLTPLIDWNLVAPNLLVFTAPPAAGHLITADFTYQFLCRFMDDTNDFEQMMINLWELKKLRFRQVRTT